MATRQASATFEWTPPRELVAVALAEDLLESAEIAANADVDPKTLFRWRQHPEFANRVAEHVRAYREAALQHGIAVRGERIAAANDRWRRMRRLILDRAADATMTGTGHQTGLLVRSIKILGAGDSAVEVEEYEVDTGLLKELRELEKQISTEVGDWTEKREGMLTLAPVVTTIEIVRPALDGD